MTVDFNFWIGVIIGVSIAWSTIALQHLSYKLFVKDLQRALNNHNKQSQEIANELIQKTASVVAAQHMPTSNKLN